jgi:uncharacterized protein (TIGR02145 family)
MNKKYQLIGHIVLILFFTACNNNSKQEDNLLKKIAIGQQEWSAENLNVDKFRNGEIIPEAKTLEEYFKYIEGNNPCWCYYDFNKNNDSIYGKLYNWYAISDKRNIAPEGWRVSTVNDWKELIDFMGGNDVAAGKLKSTEQNLWINQSAKVKDSYGFCAKPGGFLSVLSDMGDGFYSLRKSGAWWSSTSLNDNANSIWMYSKSDYSSENEIKIGEDPKRYAMSVRIIREKEDTPKASDVTPKHSGQETKTMTYKWCECNDMCYSLFVDEDGNEYNFGDISNKNNINFQCYPNNSEGGISDPLKEKKFKVTFIRISGNDFELIKISSLN